tara:strand:- start:5260 stop:5841 length:582 start_codon:yes stop_codon:yes gene_type:complete
MNEIYIEIADLTSEFRKMAFGLTTNEDRINEAVQELMLYFLSMNPQILSEIYNKDGIEGIKKYGAVVLKRSLTSKYSRFYYKYDKYYTHIDSLNYVSDVTNGKFGVYDNSPYYKSISNIAEDTTQSNWGKLEEIDRELDSLYWYDRELFKLYYYKDDGKNTLDSIAAKTKISRNSIFNTIDKVRKILKKNLNE